MKRLFELRRLVVLAVLLLATTAQAGSAVERMLTLEGDTVRSHTTWETFFLHTLARPKGDCVMLRWAPDKFPAWYLANRYGYNVLRTDEAGRVDTLAKNLFPMPLEEMKQRFEPSDSLAGAAAQMLYGKGS
jgi:hypothetical protein